MSIIIRFTIVLCSILCLHASPYISEFMASNDTTLADEDGDFTDWIEIYNPDSSSANLTGWSLTNDSASPAKWVFPSTTVPAKGHLIIFASQKNRSLSSSELHTNFKLSASGEYLALLRPDQSIATSFSPTFPPQTADISFGFGGSVATPIDSASPIGYLIPGDGSLATECQPTLPIPRSQGFPFPRHLSQIRRKSFRSRPLFRTPLQLG